MVSVEQTRRLQWPGKLEADLPLGWTVGWSGPEAAERLGATGLPATVLVSPEGMVVESRMGWDGSLEWLGQALRDRAHGGSSSDGDSTPSP